MPIDIQLTRNTCAGDAGVGNQAQVFAAAIVYHRQDAEFPGWAEAVSQEVQRPARIRR